MAKRLYDWLDKRCNRRNSWHIARTNSMSIYIPKQQAHRLLNRKNDGLTNHERVNNNPKHKVR